MRTFFQFLDAWRQMWSGPTKRKAWALFAGKDIFWSPGDETIYSDRAHSQGHTIPNPQNIHHPKPPELSRCRKSAGTESFC